MLLGPSGSGKSTLLLTLTGLVPRSIPAQLDGQIRLFGKDVGSREPWGWAADAAQFFQDAEMTLCGMTVEEEIAFALENRAVEPSEIENAVLNVMARVGLPHDWRERRTSTLSGGERQLVAWAAILVQAAPLLVADEPTAHLAPEAAGRLHALLNDQDPGQTILIVDHRLDGLIGSIDRVVALGPAGTVMAEGHPRTVFREDGERLRICGIWCPASSELDAALVQAGIGAPLPPLTVTEALAHLDPTDSARSSIMTARPLVEAFVSAGTPQGASRDTSDAPELVRLEQVACAPYGGAIALRDVSLTIKEGEILGILGANGAGKSTLGLCLAGLLPVKAGSRDGIPGGFAFQRPETQFTEGSVHEELRSALKQGLAPDAQEATIAGALARWGLSDLERRHPLELSQGEKRRLAFATLLIAERWPFLVLDEPTAGLDAHGTAKLVDEIAAMPERGHSVVLITHDMNLALRLCPRSIVVSDGRLLSDGPTEHILSDSVLLAQAGLAEPSRAGAVRWLRRVERC